MQMSLCKYFNLQKYPLLNHRIDHHYEVNWDNE